MGLRPECGDPARTAGRGHRRHVCPRRRASLTLTRPARVCSEGHGFLSAGNVRTDTADRYRRKAGVPEGRRAPAAGTHAIQPRRPDWTAARRALQDSREDTRGQQGARPSRRSTPARSPAQRAAGLSAAQARNEVHSVGRGHLRLPENVCQERTPGPKLRGTPAPRAPPVLRGGPAVCLALTQSHTDCRRRGTRRPTCKINAADPGVRPTACRASGILMENLRKLKK